jgi:TolB-like protein/DNA-binding winged helix-turn-helix (wHTH) protein
MAYIRRLDVWFMAIEPRAKHCYEFGPFRLDPNERVLFRQGTLVSLSPKVLEILMVLVRNGGHIVQKDQLMAEVWPDAFVEEANLNVGVSSLRKALGDTPEGHAYIETIPRRGYRFVAAISEIAEEPVEVIVQRRTRTRIVQEEEVCSDEPQAIPAPALPAPERRDGKLIQFGMPLAAATALATAAYFMMMIKPRAPAAAPKPHRIMMAVLPFVNLSGDPQQEYYSDGMTEELITVLGGINPRQLGVIARTSVMVYKGSSKSVAQIGKELGVDYVLEGSVERAAHRIRITAQLIQASDQTHLWAATYDRNAKDILTYENEAANAIAAQIQIRFQPNARSHLAGARSLNPDAYEAYLKGRFYWNKRNEESYTKARSYFNEAIREDPGFAAAYAGLADSYVGDPRAMPIARKALELDQNLAEAHASLAFLIYVNEWDFVGAEAELKRAIELDPNYVTGHHWYAYLLAQTGHPEQAIPEITIARQLDPLSVVVNTDAGMILYWARRNDEAIVQLHKALELDPNFDWAHFWLGRAYEQKGLYDKAIAHFEKARDAPGSLMDKTAALGHVYAAQGRRERAMQVIESLRRESARQFVSTVNLAEIYTALGRQDEAFRELDAACKSRNNWLLTIRVEPNFDPLRADPRWLDLLQRTQVSRPLSASE